QHFLLRPAKSLIRITARDEPQALRDPLLVERAPTVAATPEQVADPLLLGLTALAQSPEQSLQEDLGIDLQAPDELREQLLPPFFGEIGDSHHGAVPSENTDCILCHSLPPVCCGLRQANH